MRRGHGVDIYKKKQADTKRYNEVGKAIEIRQITHVTELLSKFKTSLEEFATKHKDKINADPEFRHHFHVMCSSIGVDPLASNKGFWSDLLGVGDFYYELGIQIIQVSVQTRASNGGIISMNEMLSSLRSSGKTRRDLSQDDVKRAVEKLSVLGSGFKIIEVAGHTMIASVPLELNNDHEMLLSIGNEDGYVSLQLLQGYHNWSEPRFTSVVNILLQEGIIWMDVYNGEERYYFPSLWKENRLGHI